MFKARIIMLELNSRITGRKWSVADFAIRVDLPCWAHVCL